MGANLDFLRTLSLSWFALFFLLKLPELLASYPAPSVSSDYSLPSSVLPRGLDWRYTCHQHFMQGATMNITFPLLVTLYHLILISIYFLAFRTCVKLFDPRTKHIITFSQTSSQWGAGGYKDAVVSLPVSSKFNLDVLFLCFFPMYQSEQCCTGCGLWVIQAWGSN